MGNKNIKFYRQYVSLMLLIIIGTGSLMSMMSGCKLKKNSDNGVKETAEPIVAINDAQRKEIIGNAGIYVDPTDIEKYSGALNATLKRKWGDKPRKQAEKFDWDKIAKEYKVLFTNLLK